MPFITYTYEELLAHKAAGVPEAALKKLKSDADEILTKPTAKVIDTKLPRPSGDPHDYVSIGPYWWPNPDTPDGLPWVNRDGRVNPDTTEAVHASSCYSRVHTLALAAFYFGDNGYSEYAMRQMYDWFINPETKINPHARYAQALPGINEGRPSGLISFSGSYQLFNGMGILDAMGLLDKEINEGVKKWFVEFENWMLTDEYGLRIDNGDDNHASWLEANLLATAVYTERPQLVKKLCSTAYARRVKYFIAEDGSQPSELRRTKAMSYTLFNLEAQLIIANIAERLGYKEYWSIDKERGNCVLRQAVDFIYPYFVDPASFPYQELYPDKQTKKMVRSLFAVSKRFPNEGYAERAMKYLNESESYNLTPWF
jgi:hypothetical protein